MTKIDKTFKNLRNRFGWYSKLENNNHECQFYKRYKSEDHQRLTKGAGTLK